MESVQRFRELVEELEYRRHSAGGLICGVSVRAKNIRYRSRTHSVTADVTVSGEDISTTYKNCVYDASYLKGER